LHEVSQKGAPKSKLAGRIAREGQRNSPWFWALV
jgi:hypothetical protein